MMKQKVTTEILKKYFQGIHGLVPNSPKSRESLTGKEVKLVKTPTYP